MYSTPMIGAARVGRPRLEGLVEQAGDVRVVERPSCAASRSRRRAAASLSATLKTRLG